MSQENHFSQIYETHKVGVYTFVINILNHNVADAQDITSETFVQLWNYLEKKKEIKNMKSFLYTIAHNLAINLIKKNKHITALNDNTIYDDHLCNNLDFEQQALQKEINKLEPIAKEIIHLTYYEELSYQEISEILSIPKNTVWTILFNTKKQLKYNPLFQSL